MIIRHKRKRWIFRLATTLVICLVIAACLAMADTTAWAETAEASAEDASGEVKMPEVVGDNGSESDTGENRTEITVRYNANGGSGAPAEQKAYAGQTIKLSSRMPVLFRRRFTHWRGSDGRKYKPGGEYEINANVTLTAQYESITIYFIGDSRTCDLYDSVKYRKNRSKLVEHRSITVNGVRCLFYAGNGARFNCSRKVTKKQTATFFNSAAKGTTNKVLADNLKKLNDKKGNIVVTWFGANDIHCKRPADARAVAKKYVDRMRLMAEKYPNVRFVLAGVTPCGPQGKYFREDSRKAFNSSLKTCVESKKLNNLRYVSVDFCKVRIKGKTRTIKEWIRRKMNLDAPQLHYKRGKMELSRAILLTMIAKA